MIRYSDDPANIRPEQLAGGFWVGWPNPPAPEDHLRILQGSYAVWLAIDDTTDLVVGFVTAISDGVLSAYIPLLEVLESHQSQGIGSELTRRMIETLRLFYQIDLICDDDVRPFYERVGMQPAGGVIIRNYDRQSATPVCND